MAASMENTDEDWSDFEEEPEEVIRANQLRNPLKFADIDTTFEAANGSKCYVRHYTSKKLPKHLMNWAFALVENIKDLYVRSEWGWDAEAKKIEMNEERARYLVVFQGQKPLAFTHFRFDTDYDQPVVYCYEIHAEPRARSMKIGSHLMKILEVLAAKTNLSKVILTVFKSNVGAQLFYERLGYTLDETNPSEEENKDYIILSKLTPVSS